MTRFAIAALATFGIVLAAGPGARAQNRSCSTTMTGTVIHGNLEVPAGATCILNDVAVAGNISVGTGGVLRIFTGSQIGGNIEANKCGFVELTGNQISVGGNLACEGNTYGCVVNGGEVLGNVSLSNNPSYAQISKIAIKGNLSIDRNSSNLPGAIVALVADNTIGGNVDVIGNRGPGNMIVGANVIQGNLQCQDNTPGVGNDNIALNTVAGNKLGQCAGL